MTMTLTGGLTDRQTAALAELCWFLGPPVVLMAVLSLAVVHYEHRLTLAYAREAETRAREEAAMDGWKRSVEQQEGAAGSLKVCGDRLETAVEMLNGRRAH